MHEIAKVSQYHLDLYLRGTARDCLQNIGCGDELTDKLLQRIFAHFYVKINYAHKDPVLYFYVCKNTTLPIPQDNWLNVTIEIEDMVNEVVERKGVHGCNQDIIEHELEVRLTTEFIDNIWLNFFVDKNKIQRMIIPITIDNY